MKSCKNLLLLLISIAIVVIILELGVRIFVPSMGDLIGPRMDNATLSSFKPDPGNPANHQQYDPYLGWVNRPGVSGTNYGPDNRQSRLVINSRGLRDREIEYLKPPGLKRIVVLGDSFAWGYGLNAEERFSDLLDQEFPGTQAINMGVVGYSTDQECTFFEREGIKYDPDLVILLVHDTDIFHNGLRANYGKAKPYFTLWEDKLERHGIPVPREDDVFPEERDKEKVSPPTSGDSGFLCFVKKILLTRFRLYQLLSERLKMIEPVRRLLVRIKMVEPGRAVEEDVSLTGAIIERMRKKAEEGGVGLLVLLVPSKEVINYHLLGGSGKKRLLKIKDTEIIRREEAVRGLSVLLQGAGIPVIDLTVPFIETSARGINLYFVYDNHWNGEANKFTAGLIAAYLREDGFN